MRLMLCWLVSSLLVLCSCSSTTPRRSASTVPPVRTSTSANPASERPSLRPPLPRDSRAEELFALGERYLRQQNYVEAARVLQQAAERQPAHRVTTASYFLAARAQQQAGNPDQALALYQELLRRFPDTRYLDDVQYHKGLILLDKPGQEAAGLYLLLNLAEQSTISDLKQRADDAARDYLYRRASLAFLQDYLTKVRAAYRTPTLEALVLRAQTEAKPSVAQQALREYQAEGNPLTDRLQRLTTQRTPDTRTTGDGRNVRIAVLLPFQSSKPDSLRDIQAQMSLQLLSGMQQALQSELFPGIGQVELRAFDTNGDSLTILRQLAGPLAEFRPDIVVGDIRNRPSRAIARLAQEQGFTHLVPLSDTDDMAQLGRNTFVVNPTESTTARALAAYIKERLYPRKVMVLDDATSTGHRKAKAFEQALSGPGVEVRRWPVVASGDIAVQDIAAAVQELKNDRFDGIYAPLTNEASVAFLLYKLAQDSVDVKVYGTDQWRAYRMTDRDLYRKFQVLITDVYHPTNDTLAGAILAETYTRSFKAPPEVFAVQGYDILRMALDIWGRQPQAASLAEALRASRRRFRGIAQDFRFPGAQSNQSVQVLQYREEDLVRLDTW